MPRRSPYGYAMDYRPTPKPKPRPKPPTGYAPAGVNYNVPVGKPYIAPTAPAASPATRAAASSARSVWDPNAYLASLQGDPMYGSAMKSFETALNNARLGLRGSIQQAVIRGGFNIKDQLGGDLAEYASDLDEQTMQAAAANPLSTRALLEQNRQTALNDLAYEASARGGLRSGYLGAGTSGVTKANQIAVNDAMSQLQDAIRGGVTGYLGVQGQLASERDRQIEAVAQRLAQLQGPAWDVDEGPSDVTNVGDVGPAAPASRPTPVGVQWGGQTFTTRAALSRWLSARGANYAQWAANHPGAAARLK